jgi:hypothetical protein
MAFVSNYLLIRRFLRSRIAPNCAELLKIAQFETGFTSAVSCARSTRRLTALQESGVAVYGYCRVSTLKQANEGESLDVQRRQIEGYALMHGLTVNEILVEEGVSGSIPVEERPVGGALFARLQKGDIVIATACSAPPSTRSRSSRA